MIKEVFRCPSCDQPVAIDCVSEEIVFDPDGLYALPCPHLSCFWICLSFVGGRKFAEKHTRSWLGTIGRGIRKIDAAADLQDIALTRYIMDCGSDTIADDLFPTVAMYTVVGGSAAERENRQRGSGEFRVLIRGKSRSAILDGWGLYSQTPQKMMQEINELSFEYEV